MRAGVAPLAACALALALALASFAVLGCGTDRSTRNPAASSKLIEIPHPSLAGADPAVQEQVRERRRGIDEADDDAEAYGDLGRVYLLYDFVEAAVACFDNAHRLAPRDFRWLYLLGYSHKLAGELEQSIVWLEKSLEVRVDSLPAMLRLGRAHLDLGDHQTARRWFEESIEIRASAPAAEGLGRIAVAGGDFSAAVEHFRRALSEQPDANSLRYALGQAYLRLGRAEEAERELAASGDVAVVIADPLVSGLASQGESAQFFLIQASEALDDQNYEAAVAAYRRALAIDPSSFSTYRSWSFALQKLGDPDGAIEALETGLELGESEDPARERRERAELHRVLGGLRALGGHDPAAIDHFQESLRLRSEQSDVRMKLANALAREGRFEEAVSDYTTLLEMHPELAPDILMRRATVLVNLGRGPEAMADFDRALGERPDDRRLRLRYADALERLGHPERAARQRQTAERGSAVENDESARISSLLDRAGTAVSRDQPEEALRHLSAALALDPENSAVLYQKASVLGHLERCVEAVEVFRRVIERQSRHAGARRGEIVCLVLLTRYAEARVRLNEALRIFSRDAQLAHLQARLLATAPEARVRDGDLALAVARRLAENADSLRIRETLALAHAESGQIRRAIELQTGLVDEAQRRGEDALAEAFRKKLAQLESGESWSAESPREILDAALR